MGEVIDLMQRTDFQPTDADRAASAAMRRRELSCFLQAVEQVKSLADPSRERVAQRLWEILEEVRIDHHITRAEIAASLWSDENASKRLDKLTLVPGKPISDEKRNRLQKRPPLFLKVARAAAGKAGLDRDAFTVRLFRETAVARAAEQLLRTGTIQTDNEDWADTLSDLLNDMGRTIIARTGFSSHVRRITENPGCYSLVTGRIYQSSNNLLPHGAMAWNYEHVDEFPPVPSIALFRESRVPSFRRTLYISPKPIEAELMRKRACKGTFRNVASHDDEFRGFQESSWRRLDVDVTAYREVRLALGAMETGHASPLFELRTVFSLSHEGKDLSLLNPWLYDAEGQVVGILENERIIPGVVDLSWPRKGDMVIASGTSDDQSPTHIPLEGEESDGGSLQMEHCYAVWAPITAATCRSLMGENPEALGGNVTARILHSGFQWLGPLPEDAGSTISPSNTSASMVEQALVSTDESASLFHRLLAETRNMMQLVSDHVEESRSEARARIERARESWSKTSGNPDRS